LREPSVLDTGPGNIQLYTAIELLREYMGRNAFDDPLGIKHYIN